MTSTVCRQCNADTRLTQVGHVEGEDGGIRVVLEGLSIAECTSGHKRFPTPGYPLELIQSLLQKDDVVTAPFAVEKGLFRKRQHCPACGKEVAAESGTTAKSRTEVTLPDLQPVVVEVALPLYRCPGCSKDTTLPEKTVAKSIMQAVANAFRSADIPPG